MMYTAVMLGGAFDGKEVELESDYIALQPMVRGEGEQMISGATYVGTSAKDSQGRRIFTYLEPR